MDERKILRFKETQGFSKWKKFFPPEAVSHPAKMNLHLLNYLIQRYTNEGDTLLDPMSGTGSTGIIAGLNGRNVICIDLEKKFHEMQVGVDCDGYTCHVLGCYERRELELTIKQLEEELSGIDKEEVWAKCVWLIDDTGHRYIDTNNTDPEILRLYDKFIELYYAKGKYEKLPLKPHHYTGCEELYKANPEGFIQRGKSIFLQGDARKLSDLLREHKDEISACLFSPPWGKKESWQRYDGEKGFHSYDENEPKNRCKRDYIEIEHPDNIGNLPLGDVDTIITSPPFKTANEGGGLNKSPPDTFRGVLKEHSLKLSDDPNNIDNMPYGKVTAIITSPPYSEGIGHSQGKRAGHDMVGKESFVGFYGDGNKENIGNLPHGDVDSIITSPPYSECEHDYKHGFKVLGDNFRGRKAWEDKRDIPLQESNIAKLKHGDIDSIITSPPYAGSTAFQDISFMKKITDDQSLKIRRGEVKGHYRSPEAELQALERMEKGKIEHEENIGSLPFSSPDAIITSPPYSEGTGHGRGKDESLQTEKKLYLHGAGSYSKTDDTDNIGEIKEHGDIDAVLTSPPYAESVNAPNDPHKRAERMLRAGLDPKTIVGGQARCGEIDWTYSDSTQNIGNLKHDESDTRDKSETYLEAMRKVYAECHSVLKPHGLMILVVKNFIREKRVVPLTEHTIKLCESVGFKLKERSVFKLPQQSFWRIIYSKKYPEVDVSDLQFEHILVFEKG